MNYYWLYTKTDGNKLFYERGIAYRLYSIANRGDTFQSIDTE